MKLKGKLDCPKCGAFLDGASTPKGEVEPQDGDLSICVYCATILLFKVRDELEIHQMGYDQFKELPEEDQAELTKIRAAILSRLN